MFSSLLPDLDNTQKLRRSEAHLKKCTKQMLAMDTDTIRNVLYDKVRGVNPVLNDYLTPVAKTAEESSRKLVKSVCKVQILTTQRVQ